MYLYHGKQRSLSFVIHVSPESSSMMFQANVLFCDQDAFSNDEFLMKCKGDLNGLLSFSVVDQKLAWQRLKYMLFKLLLLLWATSQGLDWFSCLYSADYEQIHYFYFCNEHYKIIIKLLLYLLPTTIIPHSMLMHMSWIQILIYIQQIDLLHLVFVMNNLSKIRSKIDLFSLYKT